MTSSQENPLAFFEYALDVSNLSDVLDKQIKYYGFHSHNVDVANKSINYVEQNDSGEFIKGKISLDSQLLPILRSQLEISKRLIFSSFKKNDSVVNGNMLLFHFNTVQSLVSNNKDLINHIPYFLLPLRGIVNYINVRLKEPSKELFLLKEDGVKFNVTTNLNINLKSNEEVINSIFGFMNEHNEKKEKILDSEDFNSLIVYINHLVKENEVPKIKKQLAPKISNDQLRFSFWVLHDKLYTTKKIRPYFYDFIKNVFINFENSETTSISNQFGTRSRVANDGFLPSIIKDYLIKQ